MNWKVIAEQEKTELPKLITKISDIVEQAMLELELDTWPGCKGEGKDKSRSHFLIWLQWSRKYKLPLIKTVKLIVAEFRSRLKKTGISLGISLPVLTSASAEQWLASVAKDYQTPPLPRYKLPHHYNSVEEYATVMDELRLKNKKHKTLRVYRTHPDWNVKGK